MRTPLPYMSYVLAVLACLAAGISAFACGEPPIDVFVVGKSSQVSGTVEIGATLRPDIKVKVVEFLCDGKLIASDEQAPYRIMWDTTTVAEGKHKLYAVGTTPRGERIKSYPLVVYVAHKAGADESDPDG